MSDALCWKIPFYPVEPSFVASRTVLGMLRGEGQVVVGWQNKVLVKMFQQALPQRIVTMVVEKSWSTVTVPKFLRNRWGGAEEEEEEYRKRNFSPGTSEVEVGTPPPVMKEGGGHDSDAIEKDNFSVDEPSVATLKEKGGDGNDYGTSSGQGEKGAEVEAESEAEAEAESAEMEMEMDKMDEHNNERNGAERAAGSSTSETPIGDDIEEKEQSRSGESSVIRKYNN